MRVFVAGNVNWLPSEGVTAIVRLLYSRVHCVLRFKSVLLDSWTIVIASLAWPDPIPRRGVIAFTESDNAPARNRVWPRETK